MITSQLKELLLQSLMQERGGVLVYKTALACALNEELSAEWTKYLAQTQKHVDVLIGVCARLGLDPCEMTPATRIVQHNGKALVIAMQMALAEADPAAAELTACECVVLAETKDHAGWELIGACAKELEGETAETLRTAYEENANEEHEHLYHTQGWCRELWLKSLGLKSMLPPPEEKGNVKNVASAGQSRNRR